MNEQAAIRGDNMFTIVNEPEIRSMLRRLIDQHCLFTAHYGDDPQFLLTTILGFSESGRELLLDVSPHESVNQCVLAAPSLRMHTQIDRVELRFRIGRAVMFSYEGLPAFRVPLPEQMLYLQWREFFRLSPPISRPVICTISMSCPPDAPDERPTLQARVMDIGVGGIALHVPTGFESEFQIGACFDDCRIDLPNAGLIQPSLVVRHVAQTTDARGQLRTWAGCQFKKSPALQAVVQRYVMNIERERIIRGQGVL